ncbi:MAG: potassium transporter [Pirellulaceae bacterium]|nr:MAG: potassium transporter [Pirellulaceae bacterium]
MLFSLPWAHPALGRHGHLESTIDARFEVHGFTALLLSSLVAGAVGCVLWWFGRSARGHHLFRKEAMATVGLAWIMATLLGALPYLFAGVELEPGRRMNLIDAMFESQSGFSTTGATVLTNLEDPRMVPHCILFWRSSTHFLGGLGIVVLLVAILGQGAGGKAMMRAEITGPTKESSFSRMQKTAVVFATIYIVLNALLTMIYWIGGMSLFDALCHAFGTMATGGFSTYNKSLGHFESPWIEYVTTGFMIIAGTNFGLLLLVAAGQGRRLLSDPEWQVYVSIIAIVTLAVIGFGLWHGDFDAPEEAFRNSLFQVVSIMTTTGYGTDDYDAWNNFGRGVLLLLMFVGGCAGSTGGGMKVIRHVLMAKILRHELELAYHPNVRRPLRLGDQILSDPDIRKHILVYFALVSAVFACSWLILITIEPDTQWLAPETPPAPGVRAADQLDHKLIDCASAVAATLHNIGPGYGVVGPTANYAQFAPMSKLLFVFLMMLGRLEMFSILVLFLPAFWRKI